MTDYAKVLLAIAPHGKPAIVADFAASLDACITRANLSSRLRLAHFLAQCAHESAGLATTTEYASGKAYEGRKDLGNTAKGDGVRCKGRGVIQNTGAAAYKWLSKIFGVDFYANPEKLAQFPWAALAAAEFWLSRKINADADLDSVEGVTRRINGGLNGLASRKAYLARAKHALSDLPAALIARATEEHEIAITKSKATTGAAVGSAIAVTPYVAPTPVSHAALGQYGEWGLFVVAILLLFGGAALFLSIRKHQNAAAALTAAAQEA